MKEPTPPTTRSAEPILSTNRLAEPILSTNESAAAAAEVEEERGAVGAGAEESEVVAAESDEGDEGQATGTAIAPRPYEPTAEDIANHFDNQHIPFRNWCEDCVRGRATGEKHLQRDKGTIPVISFDYLFITRNGIKLRHELEESDIDAKILVVKESLSKCIFAHWVQEKGDDEKHVARDHLLKDIQWLGYSKLILKSDNESAITCHHPEGGGRPGHG